MFRDVITLGAALGAVTGCVSPAAGKLPDPVRAMVDSAIATGDADTVKAVVSVARTNHPDDSAELEALMAQFAAEQNRQAEEAEKRKLTEIRQAGLFQRWEGEGELGALRSTGNSEDIGVTAALKLRRIGIDWRHKLSGRVDYQRSDGETTREQYFLAYEPSFDIAGNTFVFGLAQYERDRFQGFSARYSTSGGIGYRVFDTEKLKLELKAGPAWRQTDFVVGGRESYVAGLGALDLHWHFAKGLSLTETASVFAQSGNSTFTSLTGIEAGVNSRLKARLSYNVEYESDPPVGSVKTDTLSRVTLIYDF